MLRLAADENFDNDIVRGVLRRNPQSRHRAHQYEGLCGADDPSVLDWAARSGRVVLSHDVRTLTRSAYERVRAGVAPPL